MDEVRVDGVDGKRGMDSRCTLEEELRGYLRIWLWGGWKGLGNQVDGRRPGEDPR